MLSLPPITDVWLTLGGGKLQRGRGQAFYRGGDGFNVTLSDDKGCWYDFVTGESGGVLDLVQQVRGGTRQEAQQWIADTLSVTQSPEPVPVAQRRRFAQKRAIAEREATEVTAWRDWAIQTLRYWRNHLGDRARSAERWMAGDGLHLSMEHPHTIEAIKAMTDGARLADNFNDALEKLLEMEPAEVSRLRSRFQLRGAA